jgi:hypothetical protein
MKPLPYRPSVAPPLYSFASRPGGSRQSFADLLRDLRHWLFGKPTAAEREHERRQIEKLAQEIAADERDSGAF